MPRQYSQYYLRKKSLKPIGFYKRKVRGKKGKVTVPIMPRVGRRRVHVASVLPVKKPSVIKRKTVLPRDVMEERIISISRTHLSPMEQQNLQDNLRKADDEKVEELYKYWSKKGKKKEVKVEEAKVSIPKGEPKYGDKPIATYVKTRSLKNRLPEEESRGIGNKVADKLGVKKEEVWLGGSQSPKSTRLPRATSDADFFVFPEDFDANKTEDWQKYARKTADLDMSDLSKEYGREVSVTFLPSIAKNQVGDQIPITTLKKRQKNNGKKLSKA